MTNEANLAPSAIEQTPAELAGWSAEDIAWLRKLNAPLQPLAIRHGRGLWSLVMQANAVQHGLLVLESQGRGNRAIGQVAALLSKCYNEAAALAIKQLGKTPRDFMECRGDVERLMALAGVALQAGDKVSKGGILLDS